MTNNKKGIVLFSGGLDSTVLLTKVAREQEVTALSILYGQRHKKELEYAVKIAAKLGVPHMMFDMSAESIMRAGALMGMTEVPMAHFEDESQRATIVPNRNMILISLAVALAESLKLDCVWVGAHQGDAAIYPDCRREFLGTLFDAIGLATEDRVTLLYPFINKDKTGIVKVGDMIGAPIQETWSCYVGGEKHCGGCGACQERQIAFREAGVKDEVAYEHGI